MVITILILLLVSLLLAGSYTAFFYFSQARLIYHPRAYGPEFDALQDRVTLRVCYTTSAGRQTANYIQPRLHPAQPPDRLWVMFNGNAMLALDWLNILEHRPDPRAGYLLIDYPGYGPCEGQPSPAAILESSQMALAALAAQLRADPTTLYQHLNIMGYSLGAATALQLAARTRPEKIVLIAPFTSMLEMARRTVHWPVCHLLRHRFDNVARLEELARRLGRPRVTIIHGAQDALVPVAMSRRIAKRWPDWIEYHEVADGPHYLLNEIGEPFILAALKPEAPELAAAR